MASPFVIRQHACSVPSKQFYPGDHVEMALWILKKVKPVTSDRSAPGQRPHPGSKTERRVRTLRQKPRALRLVEHADLLTVLVVLQVADILGHWSGSQHAGFGIRMATEKIVMTAM